MGRTSGKRDGAGRPAEYAGQRKVTASLRLTPLARQYLGQLDSSASAEVERLVRKSKGFRAWIAAQK